MKFFVKTLALGFLFVSPAMYSAPAHAALSDCSRASIYASTMRARATVICSVAGDGSTSCGSAGDAAFDAEMHAASVCSGGFRHQVN